MPTPIHAPRVNNNDDTVRLTRVLVAPGTAVHAGDIVAEVETDKANFTVEAESDGYVVAVAHEVNQIVPVGAVLLWLGASPDETAPVNGTPTGRTAPRAAAEPTIKAAQLLLHHKLRAEDVPVSGERLTASDVEQYLASRGPDAPRATDVPALGADALPAGAREALTPTERGMLRSVLWQRHEAVPAYAEVEYDTSAWNRAAAEYQRREKLLMNPLLALMAYRLARLAATDPRINSTVVGEERHRYSAVNLGFTVQSGSTLYLVVVHDAASLTHRQFVDRLGLLQRSAIGQKLGADELTGATVSFSSMARWNVTRHVPILPAHTSLIVAHAAAVRDRGTIGATYDHRVLTGSDAAAVLRAMTEPEDLE